ncbi:eCIS core domain-containing protein [Nocardioides taihuensis]|uniref:DUF4157 domain-containing protein n=1 Tax=Nocardioides taihuensis TaxID=1835606 RepID=A0ABW0BDB6_9ACTN
MRTTTSAPTTEVAATTVWRCGGRQCGAGECAHEEDELHRHASGSAAVGPATLRVSSPDDPAEVEADRIADQLMRDVDVATPAARPGHQVQRKGAADFSAYDVDEEVKRSATDPGVAAREVDERVRSVRGGGRPLEQEVRTFMEQRFGHDFGSVRVHTDVRAAEAAQAVHAHAFTLGKDIAFAAGQWRPSTHEGRRLLAHELTHVVQQTGTSPTPQPAGTVQRDLATELPEGPVEDQADLSEAQIRSAIAFNRARYDEANTRLIQNLLGGEVTGTWTRGNIVAIAATQEQYGLTADGKVGSDTFRFLNDEQTLEGMDTTDANCLTAFNVSVAPVNFVGTNPASIEGHFRTSSEFSSRCTCSDFQYRQFIRGHARHIRGGVTTDISNAFANVPGGRLPANFREDGDTTDNPVNYGHRNNRADASPEDHYIDDANANDQANGCRYRNEDFPGLTGITPVTGDVFDLNMSFRGEIQRNGTAVETKHWTAINGRFTMP